MASQTVRRRHSLRSAFIGDLIVSIEYIQHALKNCFDFLCPSLSN